MLRVLVADRQRGKTTAAIDWVAMGERVNGYPGWSRVLIVPTVSDELRLRKNYFNALEDWSHRVYAAIDFCDGRVTSYVQVCIDDLDRVMRAVDLRRLPGEIAAMTVTGELWTPAFSPMVRPTPESGS